MRHSFTCELVACLAEALPELVVGDEAALVLVERVEEVEDVRGHGGKFGGLLGNFAENDLLQEGVGAKALQREKRSRQWNQREGEEKSTLSRCVFWRAPGECSSFGGK